MTSFCINGRVRAGEEISSLLENYYHGRRKIVVGEEYKRASVLILMVLKDSETYLLYTRRTERMLEHKGQVSFPGGARERGDIDDVDTALRETAEEIGVRKDHIAILGRLPEMVTITQYLVSPIVGWMDWQENFNVNPNEVERVFLTPVDWLIDGKNSTSKRLLLRDGRLENVHIFTPYEGEIIWGITARLTCRFLRALGIV